MEAVAFLEIDSETSPPSIDESSLPQFVSMSQLEQITSIPENFFKRKNSRGDLPGAIRIGKYVRVELSVFLKALRSGEIGVIE